MNTHRILGPNDSFARGIVRHSWGHEGTGSEAFSNIAPYRRNIESRSAHWLSVCEKGEGVTCLVLRPYPLSPALSILLTLLVDSAEQVDRPNAVERNTESVKETRIDRAFSAPQLQGQQQPSTSCKSHWNVISPRCIEVDIPVGHPCITIATV